MTKTENAPRRRRNRPRTPRRDPVGPAPEEDLNRTFHDYENEEVPQQIKALAERLDRVIDEVVKKKTN